MISFGYKENRMAKAKNILDNTAFSYKFNSV